MIGDVWEWTADAFLPYHEFEETPGDQPAFSRYAKVLRGGSWATRIGAIRTTSRRPGKPELRYLFSGFRCARDA